MIIRLGQGFWVDASDGLNWTLMRDVEGRKRPATLGYFSNLGAAMERAVFEGMSECPDDIPISDLGHFVTEVAQSVLGEVTIETVREASVGLVKRFKLTPRQSVQDRPAA